MAKNLVAVWLGSSPTNWDNYAQSWPGLTVHIQATSYHSNGGH